MNRLFEILDLLNQRDYYLSKLKSMKFGSIEVRENKDHKYIYTHYQLDKDSGTMYIGEYSDDLYNQTIENNNEAKKYKKELRRINKRLNDLDFNDSELSDKVKWNIDLAKRMLPDTVYKQAILEGINTTFIKTDDIIQGGIVKEMSVSDVYVIVNLKHAWEFILNKYIITSKTSFDLLCAINKLVEEGFYYNAGQLRTTPVSITGTSYIPDFSFEADIKDDINNILNKKINDVDKSIELLLYVMRKQMFIDGNKRCAVILANHYLISKGKGLLVVPDDRVEEFRILLGEYYDTNKKERIYSFLKECYFNIDIK